MIDVHSEPQSQVREFLRFFLFLLPFRNSIMPNNIFSKNSIIWVFQRNFMFFLKIAMYQKIAKFSTLSTGVKLQSQMEVFFDFFSFYYHLGTVSWQITFFKKLNNLSFSTKFYVFFWRLQCTKKLRNSPLCPREWTSNHKWKFLRFFLFLLPFRNSIMPNNIFSKNSIIWVFQRNCYVFFEDCNVPKNCEILHFVHRSEPQSQMEVFFDFFSFYYHLGTVSCQITFFKKLNNLSFSTKFYVFFWRLQCTKKLRNSPLCPRSEPQSQMEVFFDFFSFYYHLGTVSWQITFQKTQ